MTDSDKSDVAALLREGQRFALLCHTGPDGDAVGSMLGLSWLLSAQGKLTTLLCADPVPDEYRTLPGADGIQTSSIDLGWNAVIALDASDPQRLGSVFDMCKADGRPVIVLDHHITNTFYGSHNWIDPAAAATAQVVLDLAHYLAWPVGRESAVCLMTGLVTDTRGFRTSNVTPSVLESAIELMRAGADLPAIATHTLDTKPFPVMRLWGMALANAQLRSGVAWTHITQEMRKQAGSMGKGNGALASFLLGAPEARLSATFSELADGQVEISFRARPGLDVSGLAFDLGGGGHPQAAGCTVHGPVEDAEGIVLPLLTAIARSAVSDGQ